MPVFCGSLASPLFTHRVETLISPLSYASMSVCLCACVRVQAEARERPASGILPNLSPPCSWRQSPSLNLEISVTAIDVWSASPLGIRMAAAVSSSCGCQGSKLRSSCLHGKALYQQSHLTAPHSLYRGETEAELPSCHSSHPQHDWQSDHVCQCPRNFPEHRCMPSRCRFTKPPSGQETPTSSHPDHAGFKAPTAG